MADPGQRDPHAWVRARLAAQVAGLLEEDEERRIEEHLAACDACRGLAAAAASPGEEAGAHVDPALIGAWPRAHRELRGLERTLVRLHLERCAACRQDLEVLGHEPRLERAPELESIPLGPAVAAAGGSGRDETGAAAPASRPLGRAVAAAGGPGQHVQGAPAPAPLPLGRSVAAAGGPGQDEAGAAAAPSPVPAANVIRIVRPEPAGRRRRERLLIGWASLSTAAAAAALALHLSGPRVEIPAGAAPAPPPAMTAADGSLTLRLEPRPRSLSGPARGPRGGKVNVIPVLGPVRSLALAVQPLNVPDTSLVMVSLLNAAGDTLFAVRHRQWEFLPRRMLVIDGEESPLEPGQYLLVLASAIAGKERVMPRMRGYRFELRPRTP